MNIYECILMVSPVLSISVLVEEWITLLASDPVVKGNEFLFCAYNKIK
jgi:hypothetical protein